MVHSLPCVNFLANETWRLSGPVLWLHCPGYSPGNKTFNMPDAGKQLNVSGCTLHWVPRARDIQKSVWLGFQAEGEVWSTPPWFFQKVQSQFARIRWYKEVRFSWVCPFATFQVEVGRQFFLFQPEKMRWKRFFWGEEPTSKLNFRSGPNSQFRNLSRVDGLSSWVAPPGIMSIMS